MAQEFFWVLFEALGIYFGFDFCPYSIIPVSWNLEYPPWGLKQFENKIDQKFGLPAGATLKA